MELKTNAQLNLVWKMVSNGLGSISSSSFNIMVENNYSLFTDEDARFAGITNFKAVAKELEGMGVIAFVKDGVQFTPAYLNKIK